MKEASPQEIMEKKFIKKASSNIYKANFMTQVQDHPVLAIAMPPLINNKPRRNETFLEPQANIQLPQLHFFVSISVITA